MLSHLVGASRRADVARVHELEVTCAALDGKLAQLKHDHRAVLKERKAKKACKHLDIQFVPLRSSGLSSFARGIRKIASPEPSSSVQYGLSTSGGKS